MIRRVLDRVGVNAPQWRALVRTYLRIDLRRAGGPSRRGEKPAHRGAVAYTGLVLLTGLSSAFLGLLAIALRDAFTAAVVVTTYAALNTSLLVLIDFTGLVVSPDDYRILGSLPVGSRTYLAARLASVLLYVAGIAGIVALLPSAALGFWHDLGFGGVLGTIAAAVLCSSCGAIVVIRVYSGLISIVHPRRLTRVLSYLQLVAASAFLGGYYLMTRAFQEARIRDLSIGGITWIWAFPSTWFASLVPVLGGVAESAQVVGSLVALALCVACVPLAAGRLSLAYAERLSEISATSETPSRRRKMRLPGFRHGEAFAVATLVRAQFRYDPRFRLAILGMLPVTAFYIALGLEDGIVADPFVARGGAAGAPLYFAMVFLPMTLHSSLLLSDSWRSAWVFFATPADPARLIVSAKNFVAVFFLGAYVCLLASVWAVFYERVWHAVVHALVTGTLAHFLLQAAAILHPALPFAAEPHKAERSSQTMGLFFVAAIVGGGIQLVLPYLYATTARTLTLAAVLAALTLALERLLHVRARAAVLQMEFRS